MKVIRILVASPSPVERSRVAKALSLHPLLEVIEQAADLSQTYTLAEALEPDVVLLAREYMSVPEFDCMKSLFYALETRWLVIGGSTGKKGAPRRSDPAYPAIEVTMTAQEVLDRIREVQAVRAVPGTVSGMSVKRKVAAWRQDRVVLIGASTGGVDALLTVLANFPADCPPTAIVQHTGRGFSESLIKLLDRRCAAEVVTAEQGLTLKQGMICVAGGNDGHFRLRGKPTLTCSIASGEAVSGHVPSIDELFLSALPIADRVVAVLLTGMGRDGADGMLALRQAGAQTIGQDEASSVVYGMPRAAFEIGAVQSQMALDRIGPEILRLCAREAEPRLAAR